MQAATQAQDVYSTDVPSSSSSTTTVQAEAQALSASGLTSLLAEGVLDETEALSWLYAVDWRDYITRMERANE